MNDVKQMTDGELNEYIAEHVMDYAPRNYCADLNAIHEAEERLTKEQWMYYVHELEKASLDHNHNMSVVHASARQRAEALVMAVGGGE